MTLVNQVAYLFLLSLPIACITWTITHEEVFREPRNFCLTKSNTCKSVWQRKFFYLFTCDYCFSHYVTVFFLFVTKYHLLYDNWRGYLVGGLALVWVANIYMSLFSLLRTDLKKNKIDNQLKERKVENKTNFKLS